MTTAPSLEIKPLVFQADRGPLSQDALYAQMGYRFILAPNRYRKLVGKIPYELSESAYMAMCVEEALIQNPEVDNIRDLWEAVVTMGLPEPVMSSGLRMFGLTADELHRVQAEAVAMMKSDWPDYADQVVGYEPHFNMFDEVLIWKA
jgi:hypothetical protein